MRSNVNIIAKGLCKLSIDKSGVNEKRVAEIVKTLVHEKPLHYIKILEQYKKLIEKYYLSKQIIVEVPKGYDKSVSLKTNKQIVVHENDTIVYGVRVRDGDWVIDNTLKGKLESLVKGY